MNTTSQALPIAFQQKPRLTISMPMLDRYNANIVLQQIAAGSRQFSCGKVCSNCEIAEAHYRKPPHDLSYDCVGLLAREAYLADLSENLHVATKGGHVILWNKAGDKQSRFYEGHRMPFSPPLSYRDRRFWLRSSYFIPAELMKYLGIENIRFEALEPPDVSKAPLRSNCTSQPDLMESPDCAATGEVANAIDAASVALLVANTETNPDASQRPAQHRETEMQVRDVARKKRQRADPLKVEILELLEEIQLLTPAQLLRKLQARAGNEDSCVIEKTPNGFKWKNSAGEHVLADYSNICDRLRRLKTNKGGQ
ncbi:MAG: hypothetical protein IPH08_11210 [Rhodocyclaceae bacterium]|nr:hypothetical protein [Rhodocyclaceae bacterium]